MAVFVSGPCTLATLQVWLALVSTCEVSRVFLLQTCCELHGGGFPSAAQLRVAVH